jgi:hypothetical protein
MVSAVRPSLDCLIIETGTSEELKTFADVGPVQTISQPFASDAAARLLSVNPSANEGG